MELPYHWNAWRFFNQMRHEGLGYEAPAHVQLQEGTDRKPRGRGREDWKRGFCNFFLAGRICFHQQDTCCCISRQHDDLLFSSPICLALPSTKLYATIFLWRVLSIFSLLLKGEVKGRVQEKTSQKLRMFLRNGGQHMYSERDSVDRPYAYPTGAKVFGEK